MAKKGRRAKGVRRTSNTASWHTKIRLKNIGGAYEHERVYIRLEHVVGFDHEWEQMQRETLWYYPWYDLLIVKSGDIMFFDNKSGEMQFVSLPSSGLVPIQLDYIGTI